MANKNHFLSFGFLILYLHSLEQVLPLMMRMGKYVIWLKQLDLHTRRHPRNGNGYLQRIPGIFCRPGLLIVQPRDLTSMAQESAPTRDEIINLFNKLTLSTFMVFSCGHSCWRFAGLMSWGR